MDAGIGEMALLGAVVGGGMSAAQGKNPLQGALLGGALGGIGGAIAPEALGLGSTDAAVASTQAAGEQGIGALAQGTSQMVNQFADQGLTLGQDEATKLALQNQIESSAVDQGVKQSLSTALQNGADPSQIASSLGQISNMPTATSLATPSMVGQAANYLGQGMHPLYALGGLGLLQSQYNTAQAMQPPGLQAPTGILSQINPYSAMGVKYPTSFGSNYTYSAKEGGVTHMADGGISDLMQYQGQDVGIPSGVTNTSEDILNYNLIPGGSDNLTYLQKLRNSDFVNPFHLASGGISDLGSYSDGGRLLQGPGTGVSDSIPASIAGKQPARLADGEFVVPARIVSEIGQGSTDAGARKLYQMMDRIQRKRSETIGKNKQFAKDTKAYEELDKI